jgi:methylenetetrahydrofolate dehydrogenase (NADP+)/methenyltetrahydrofolate cyclohydrolase
VALIDGKALAERIRGEIADEVRELGEIGLATVLVGDDPASDIYIRLKHKAAAEVGINAKDIRLASQTTEDELLAQVAELNGEDAIDGLLVQLPLPDHIDEARVIRAIDPVKDVDGLHPLNFGQLVLGHPTHVGATARAQSWSAGATSSASRRPCSSSTRTRPSPSATRGRAPWGPSPGKPTSSSSRWASRA